MSAPTREQVIQWAISSGTICGSRELALGAAERLERLAALAYAAGQEESEEARLVAEKQRDLLLATAGKIKFEDIVQAVEEDPSAGKIGRELRRRIINDGSMTLADLLGWCNQLVEERDELLALIKNDAFAMSFQSMGQYRTALIASVKGGAA